MTKSPGILWLLIVFLNSPVFAGVEPADHSVLNHTDVYFEEEFVRGAVSYEIFIFQDSVHQDRHANIYAAKNHLPAFWFNQLQWATAYGWYVVALDSGRHEISRSKNHAFRLQEISFLGFDKAKVEIRRNLADKHAGGLISIDYTRSIYNRSGEAVWTIPANDSIMDKRIQVRDLKVTKDNTITFLTGKAPLEVDFEGNVLWAAPYPLIIKDDTVTYHHEFQKTSRNTYMVLVFRREYRKVLGNLSPEIFEKESELKTINGVLHKKTMMSVLLEFDAKGRIIWSWDSNSYVTDADLNHKKNQNGAPNFATHANAFSENKEGTKVYVGFRDLNRIVRIDKKTKRVEASYGEKYPSGHGQLARNAFRRQHGAQVTDHHTILVFNNNSNIAGGGIASVVELSEKISPRDSAVAWKLEMNFDSIKGKSVSGGNVVELPNKNLLVCAGTFNRIIEVTRKKEIVWDAFVQSRSRGDSAWQIAPQYRCNWTPLLRQYRFLARFSQKSLENPQAPQIVIANTGNSADSYFIELTDEKGKVIRKLKTPVIKEGAESVQRMDPLTFKGKIRINVRSAGSSKVQTLQELNED
jgi:hypothetical protein